MATITPTWTEATNLHTSGTVAAAASATDDIDLDNLGYDMVLVTIEIAFGGTPDGDCTVEVLGSSDSGTNDDTVALHTLAIEEAASTTKRISLQIKDVPYIAVKVTNNDSTATVTYDSWYAGRKFTSA